MKFNLITNRTFPLAFGLLVLLGVGCTTPQPAAVSPSVSEKWTALSPIEQTAQVMTDDDDRRAATANRYMLDPMFVSFMKSLQPADCKDQTPTVSYIDEANLLGDNAELLVDATSCEDYSSGADMNLVARKNSDGTYTDLKINGQKMIGDYSWLELENGELVQASAVHNPGDDNAGPTGGTDELYLKWNGSEFVTAKTAHVPFSPPIPFPTPLVKYTVTPFPL